MNSDDVLNLTNKLIMRVSATGIFDEEAKNTISLLADYSVHSNLYLLFKNDGFQFWKSMTWDTSSPEKVLDYLIDRLNIAPSKAHALGMVILVMPKLRVALESSGIPIEISTRGRVLNPNWD